MEPGNDPKIFILKMDRTVAEVKREGLDIKEDQISVIRRQFRDADRLVEYSDQ